MKVKGAFLAVLSAVCYGFLPFFILPIKAAGFPLDTALFYRFLIAAAFLLVYFIYKRQGLGLTGREFLILSALGVLFALSAEFLFWAYDFLTPGIASTILFVYPVIVAVIMAVFYHEKLTVVSVVSLVITLAGVFILSVRDSVLDINFIGLLIALMSAVAYALYIVIVNRSKVSGGELKVTFYSLLFSSAYYLGKVIILGHPVTLPDAAMVGQITLFAFVTTVVTITALIYAIKLIGSTQTAILGALEPVVAVAVSVWLFGEDLTVKLIVGVVLILVGVIVNVIGERLVER